MQDRAAASDTDFVLGPRLALAAEDERSREVERELDRSRSVSAAIVWDLSDAVIAADPTGGIRIINNAARVLFGSDPEIRAAAIMPEHLVLFDRQGRRVALRNHPLSVGRTVPSEHLQCSVMNGSGVRHVILRTPSDRGRSSGRPSRSKPRRST